MPKRLDQICEGSRVTGYAQIIQNQLSQTGAILSQTKSKQKVYLHIPTYLSNDRQTAKIRKLTYFPDHQATKIRPQRKLSQWTKHVNPTRNYRYTQR